MPNKKQFKTHKEYLQWYKDYRQANRNKLRVYNRKYNKQWRKENGYENENKWHQANPQKTKAQLLLNYAVRIGAIKRQPCEVCGKKKAQGHHEDYSKPLEVKWLCALCHKNLCKSSVDNSVDKRS